MTGGQLAKYFVDLGTAWWVLLAMCGISCVFACIYLFLLRCCAGPMIWISFISIFALLITGGVYVYELQYRYAAEDSTSSAMKWCGVTLFCLAGVYLLILLCCCNRIRLGVAIMKAAS